MRQTITTPQDLSERFEAAASDSFRFLEEKFGFSKSTMRPDSGSVNLTYQSQLIYVNVVFGPPAYEPEMSFGRCGIDNVVGGYCFEAGDLIQLDGCRDWRSKPGEGTLEGQVTWLASILEDCGKECLTGDQSIYNYMKCRRDILIDEQSIREQTDVLSNNVEAAWISRDYQRIVHLYSNYRGVLTELDRRRLRYARDHL